MIPESRTSQESGLLVTTLYKLMFIVRVKRAQRLQLLNSSALALELCVIV